MCGIAGFIGEDRGRIERMTKALVHRGPDGNAVYMGHDVSLGHARLAILDPRPDGDQPMWNDAKTIVLVFNGEIYNYQALRSAEKFECRTGTDTEVLLKLYEKYGIDFVQYLRGMFAFGLYDTRSQTLHLARDTSGIKPLYLTSIDGRMHFASEMRSLMTAFKTKPALNMRSLSRYLRLQYVPGPETMCQGIESLTPGTILTIHDNKESRRTFKTAVTPMTFKNTADFREYFPTLMDSVVRDHMTSDRPIGIFLSGGMDSSIILHHMACACEKPIQTFTVRFDATEEEGRERFNRDADLALLTAKHYGTEHHEILVTAEDFKNAYAETARALDQPNADHVSVAQYLLARLAKKSVDVVLTGAGGDELFGGYPRYQIARILRDMAWIPSALRSLSATVLGYPSDMAGMSVGPALMERLLSRSTSEWSPLMKDSWLKDDDTSAWFQHAWMEHQCSDSVRTFMETDRATWLVDESLRLVDGTTMASGLEARVPFLDPLIISASHGTKTNWHIGYKQTKKLLKETYAPILPPHLFTLKKASFYPPLAKWLRRESAPLIEDSLDHPRIKALFNIEELRKLQGAHRSKQGYHLHVLHAVIQLQHWFDGVYDAS